MAVLHAAALSCSWKAVVPMVVGGASATMADGSDPS